MATPERPLSPHLQVYRPQITTVLSILHRITGVALAFYAFGLAWWLLALSADGSQEQDSPAYEAWSHAAYSVPGRILIAGFTFCLIYHLLNGIRHLFWDAGKGFEIQQFQRSGWAVVVLSVVLTAGLLVLSMSHGGFLQ